MEIRDKKYAVCISGIFRGDYKLALNSIYEKLVNPLSADVFIYTWDNCFVFSGYQNTGATLLPRILGKDILELAPQECRNENNIRIKLKNTYDKLCKSIIVKLNTKEILEQFNVTELGIVSEKSFTEELQSNFDQSGYWNLNQYKMFYMMYKCNELMHHHEKSSNMKYDTVIRVRPDMFLLKELNLRDFDNLRVDQYLSLCFLKGPDDVLFSCKSCTMDKLLGIYPNMLKTGKLNPFIHSRSRSHILLKEWLLCNKIEIVPITGSIVPEDHDFFSLQKCLDEAIPNISQELEIDLKNLQKKGESNISDYINFSNILCNKFGWKEVNYKEKDIAFVCPTYPPRNKYAKTLLKSFYDNKLDEQSDLFFVFTNQEDASSFGEYPNIIILPDNSIDLSRTSIRQGIVSTKKFYAISKLHGKYKYLICIDDDALFYKNITLLNMCNRFYSEKILIGNLTRNTALVSQIMEASEKQVNNLSKFSVKSNLYFWFNQPCIYFSEYMDDFFKKIDLTNRLFNFTWYEFDFYMYGYYLMMYKGFLLVDACCQIPCDGFAESCHNANVNFLPQIVDRMYQCHRGMLKALDNPNLFMLIHTDR
ncbi:MAG: hypothetical protein ACI4V7_10660 [Succinivibrionaceae bacterium]